MRASRVASQPGPRLVRGGARATSPSSGTRCSGPSPSSGTRAYLLEKIGPELRQYIVAANDEERPFSRDQRRYIYASSKGVDNYFGFGSDNDLEHAEGYPVIKQRTFSEVEPSSRGGPPRARRVAAARPKVLGRRPRARREPFRPGVGGQRLGDELGSLSAHGRRGAQQGRGRWRVAWHNTGEGGLSRPPPPRRRPGAAGRDGVLRRAVTSRGRVRPRPADAGWSSRRRSEPIEIKLSQGAKPGLGGLLPARQDHRGDRRRSAASRATATACSPSRHTAFHDVDSMLDFVETVADVTGLPVGIKSAVGDADLLASTSPSRCPTGSGGVDFVTIDGGEGGTGAAPLVFADHVSLPFQAAFPRAYRRLRAPRAGRGRRLHRLGEARPARERPRRVRDGRRPGQRRPRGDARHRLPPDAEVPRRPPARRGWRPRTRG